MAQTHWREAFIARMSREGMRLDLIRRVLRHAATLQRLAEAQCNGDYPYNGDRDRPPLFTFHAGGHRAIPGAEDVRATWDRRYVVCPECQASGVSRFALRKGVCPDCRTTALLRAALEGSGWRPVFQGDPRGYVVKLAKLPACICAAGDPVPGAPHPNCPVHGTHEAYYSSRFDQDIDTGRAEARGDVIRVPA